MVKEHQYFKATQAVQAALERLGRNFPAAAHILAELNLLTQAFNDFDTALLPLSDEQVKTV